MPETVSADFVRQVRLALEVLQGDTSLSPTDEIAAMGIGGGPGSDTTAIHTDVAAEIDGIDEKEDPPFSADIAVIEDDGDSLNKKKLALGSWPPTLKYGLFGLSADQTSNLNVNDHVEFNISEGESTRVDVQTGVGQANGIFELDQNGIWLCIAWMYVEFSASAGNFTTRWRRNGDGTLQGFPGLVEPATTGNNRHVATPAIAIFEAIDDPAEVELRITISSNVNSIEQSSNSGAKALLMKVEGS